MEGRLNHCPHLGLKHTRSIRFSSPTPEHRCYIFGEPLPIEVDQRSYCLGARYPECPRFSGQEAPPTAAPARNARLTSRPTPRLLAFWKQLRPFERILYLSLLGLLVLILATYGIIVGIVLPAREAATATPTPTTEEVRPTTAPPVPTDTKEVIAPTMPVTRVPTRVSPGPTDTVSPTEPSIAPTTPPATTQPATAAPTDTPRPATAPPTTVVVVPTATPVPPPEYTWSTLYFLGPNKAYYVPVSRQGPFTLGVARRAIEFMIAGPLGGSNLLRTIPSGMGLLNIYVEGGTAFVDFDHSFEELGAGRTEALAVVLALTEFSTVDRVQFMVRGVATGLPGNADTSPVERPAYVNFENPYGLEPGNAVALTLYFATPDRQHLFPIVRYVPSTTGVARAAIEEMIKGPSAAYQGVAVSALPADTQILNIYRDGNTIAVDFNRAFLNAPNPAMAVNALIFAMTDLTADAPAGLDSVRITVEGIDLGAHWGASYSGNLYRPLLNPE